MRIPGRDRLALIDHRQERAVSAPHRIELPPRERKSRWSRWNGGDAVVMLSAACGATALIADRSCFSLACAALGAFAIYASTSLE